MFSFLKRRISATELADADVEGIQRNVATGYTNRVYPKDCELPIELVKQEWLYFDVFVEDLCVFASFAKRDTRTKNAILDRFWMRIREWLTTIQVPALPERRCIDMTEWKLMPPGGIICIPAETSETAYDRVRRRGATYGAAIRTPHPLGENYGVAKVFTSLCGGVMNAIDLLAVSTYFHERKVGFAKLVKSYRVTAPCP